MNLYTLEYFRLLRARLAPGGVVTYWLPVHQLLARDTQAIVGAFCGAFPDCSLWAGTGFDWMLVGTNGLAGPVPEDRLARPFRDPGTRAAMADVGLEVPEQIGALFIGDAVYLRDLVGTQPPLVDDFPQRIMADAAHEAGAVPRAKYREVMDARAARERFSKSRYHRHVQHLLDNLARERIIVSFQGEDGLLFQPDILRTYKAVQRLGKYIAHQHQPVGIHYRPGDFCECTDIYLGRLRLKQ